MLEVAYGRRIASTYNFLVSKKVNLDEYAGLQSVINTIHACRQIATPRAIFYGLYFIDI